MSVVDPQIGVPFNLEVWKKYTKQTKTGAAFSFFYRSKEFQRLNKEVENLLQNPTEANKEAVSTAFDAWIKKKLGNSRRSMPSGYSKSAAAISSRNVDGFLEELDMWLKGLDREYFTEKDDVTIEQMRSNLWDQTVGNLRVSRLTLSTAAKNQIESEVEKQKSIYKSSKKTVKREIKEHANAAKFEIVQWLRKQVGLERQEGGGIEDEEFEFDEATRTFLEQCIGELLTELAEDMVPFWGAAKTTWRTAKAVKQLGRTCQHYGVKYEIPSECDCEFVQVALDQCFERLVKYQGVTVATLASKATVQVASAAGSFGTLDTAVSASASLTAALIRIRQLREMLSLARRECGQANRILRHITTSAGLTRLTIRELVYACPIIACHLIKDMSSAFIFDDFVLGGENIRFRKFAVGTVLPSIDLLRKKATHICNESVISLEKFTAPVTTIEQLTAGEGLENFRRLVNKQIEKRRGVLGNWHSVVGAVMAANEEAIDELIDEPKPDPGKMRKLDDLARSAGQAADEYEQTFQRYKFASKFLRNRTEQSMGCFNYLRGGFQSDIKRAKNNLADESMYLIPQRVIEFLLSNNAGQGVKNDASRKGFSGEIGNLDPLRKGSDMQKILLKHYNNWRAKFAFQK